MYQYYIKIRLKRKHLPKPRPLNLIIAFVFLLFLLSCGGNSKEANALLNTIPFKEMTSEQKKTVLSKIIAGREEPYKSQHTKISMKLAANPSKPILWKGKIADSDNGLIKISTTVQGKNWDDFKSAGDYGIVYVGKDLFMIVTEKTLDSLVLALKPDYEFKYVDCEPQICLEQLGSRLKHSGSIGKLKFMDGKVNIEYVKDYKSYKKLNPKSNVTKEQWEDYFESGDGLEKTLVDVPVRIMKELEFVNRVELKIPFKGKLYSLSISKEELEKYTKMDIATIRKDWNKKFVDKYVYDRKERKRFITKFKD